MNAPQAQSATPAVKTAPPAIGKALEADAAAKAKAKEEATKAAAAAAEQKAKEKAAAKAEREAKAAQRLADLQAANPDRKYLGPMLALADRVKAGAYVKGMNGQLRSDDEVARALEVCLPEDVVKLGMLFFGHTENKYAALNKGQQSMNYRNIMRGAIRKATEIEIGGEKFVASIERLKTLRDDNGLATAEKELAAKAEAKLLKAKQKEAAEAAKKAEAEKKAAEAAKNPAPAVQSGPAAEEKAAAPAAEAKPVKAKPVKK